MVQGNPRSESGVSQLDKSQLDPAGHGFSVRQYQQLRGTHPDHWGLFTSELSLLASQNQAGSFLLRLNRSQPNPAPQRGPG